MGLRGRDCIEDSWPLRFASSDWRQFVVAVASCQRTEGMALMRDQAGIAKPVTLESRYSCDAIAPHSENS